MENSASYLHKKFKKQLNVIQNNEKQKSGEGASVLELGKEKATVKSNNETKNECLSIIINDQQSLETDNNNVPKYSTNNHQNSSFLLNNSTKSSISIANLQSTTSSVDSSTCISYLVSSSDNQQHQQQPLFKPSSTSFDTIKFNPSESSAKSSILESKLYRGNLTASEDILSSTEANQDEFKSDPNERLSSNSSGKYVCTYCNLVCSKPSVLQKHIRAHTNERPYPCISCGFSFKTRSNLYKHCRSRTHANRVMGNNKTQEINEMMDIDSEQSVVPKHNQVEKVKPYKPRFHTNVKLYTTKEEENTTNPDLSHHINEIINKNNSIVNSDPILFKKRSDSTDQNAAEQKVEEPLNLTNKNRKRSMSEVVEPVAQKSLIKELLLKNLYSDMQCPHCKMLFQTVTELELHKLRSCKGFVKPGAKYSRSNSVNVASILTHNKNALDDLPSSQHLQSAIFPSLKSPGPCLGRTRLVENDKNKSFSFEDGLTAFSCSSSLMVSNDKHLLSPASLQDGGIREKKMPVKLFGGEVKITQTSGETTSFKIDNSPSCKETEFVEFSGKLSENRVVKSTLQSGGTVLTNKPNYPKFNCANQSQKDCIKVYKSASFEGRVDESLDQTQLDLNVTNYKYTNIMDFSQKAVKLLTPNIKQPNLTVPGIPIPNKFIFPDGKSDHKDEVIDLTPTKLKLQHNLYNPMNLLVNGKVVRYVPGIPGPVAAELPPDVLAPNNANKSLILPTNLLDPLEIKTDVSPKLTPGKDKQLSSAKKFSRPNTLALKPTTACLKQNHGLTPTMFNQILISPDTPRVAKKYVQQFLHGNYFSYLGLKCSTKPVYCTLNKTQPFYVPHFNKLSMYSEWRQQDTKTDRFYVSAYDSRHRHQRYTMAGKCLADHVVHSSYKFIVSESQMKAEKSDHQQKASAPIILGGYECNDDYTYIRGRGRGRYVCDQCGIRCKKPSMLKKHIKTHSNDRPYTCNHCNFSFKTKGNLTKHMKSKVHTKNYIAGGSSSGSSTQMSGTQSSESDTEDSGMDSSDESTRREEHEAAYGLLSLSQKTAIPSETSARKDSPPEPAVNVIMDNEEIVHASKTNYAKNKILNEKTLNFNTTWQTTDCATSQVNNFAQFLGKAIVSRPLTYPYTTVHTGKLSTNTNDENVNYDMNGGKNIKQFHVVQKYAAAAPAAHQTTNKSVCPQKLVNDTKCDKTDGIPLPIVKVNDVVIGEQTAQEMRKRKFHIIDNNYKSKVQKNDGEVMDLSVEKKYEAAEIVENNDLNVEQVKIINNQVYSAIQKKYELTNKHYMMNDDDDDDLEYENCKNLMKNGNLLILSQHSEQQYNILNDDCSSKTSFKDCDNSAMETLAEIATKQVKLEKNTLAKSVASEYLKLATKNEYSDQTVCENSNFPLQNVKSEGSKSCSICLKNFSKPSQLRLHMNIHYLERPFRCESCSVSFRTKGHLQKHERSAGHHNKLSSSPALSSSEPRPFKCVDCNIAFRIHGHLAKHLRSKMHIMKLECLAKIPFGLYAELERSNSLLTEINTADGDQCLESLKTLAKKVFVNDPNKLNQLDGNASTMVENLIVDS